MPLDEPALDKSAPVGSFNLKSFRELITNEVSTSTKLPSSVSTSDYQKVVAAVQILYITSGRKLPAIHDIMDRSAIRRAKVEAILRHNTFREEMLRRGIQWPKKWSVKHYDGAVVRSRMSPQQVMALQIMTDPTNSRTQAQRLKQCGISYATWRNWLQEPLFGEAFRNITEQMLEDSIGDVHVALTNKAVKGDVTAIKTFYEVSGRHDPARQQILDLGRIVGLVLEILTRHVTDTAVLSRVTSDIDTVLSGGNLKTIDAVPANYITPEVPLEVIDAEVIEHSSHASAEALSEVANKELPEDFFDFKD